MSGKLYIAKLRYKKNTSKILWSSGKYLQELPKIYSVLRKWGNSRKFWKITKTFYTRCIALLKIYKILRSMLNAFMLCIYNGCILCFYCEKLSKCIQTLIRIFGFFHSFSIFFHFSILNLLFRSSQRNFRNSIFLDFLCPNMSR